MADAYHLFRQISAKKKRIKPTQRVKFRQLQLLPIHSKPPPLVFALFLSDIILFENIMRLKKKLSTGAKVVAEANLCLREEYIFLWRLPRKLEDMAATTGYDINLQGMERFYPSQSSKLTTLLLIQDEENLLASQHQVRALLCHMSVLLKGLIIGANC